jgi:hypothetical protein
MAVPINKLVAYAVDCPRPEAAQITLVTGRDGGYSKAIAQLECGLLGEGAQDDLTWVRQTAREDVERPADQRQGLAGSRSSYQEYGSIGRENRITLSVVEVLDDGVEWVRRRSHFSADRDNCFRA